MTTLRKLATEYDHFDETTRAFTYVDVFNVTACEVCGVEVLAANVARVACSRVELESAGLKNRLAPYEEIAWSELHEAATCSACCYEPAAARKPETTDEARA